MATLAIHIDADKSDLALAAFPFNEGQHIEQEVENDGIVHVYVTLGDFEDTTAAQEQFLDTNSAVMKYVILV